MPIDINIIKKISLYSAIFGAISQAKEKGGEKAMDNGRLSALLFNMDSDFEIR